MYIYIYIYIYIKYIEKEICNTESNVAFWLPPQWLCGNSCTWANNIMHMYMLHSSEEIEKFKNIIHDSAKFIRFLFCSITFHY